MNISNTNTNKIEGLSDYIRRAKSFPMLAPEEEANLLYQWNDFADEDALARLVSSHLRLVIKIAMQFRGYGLPVEDLISEGTIGLIQGIKRFDTERGFRLSTYVVWWVRAAVQEYVMHSWSLVKVGTTVNQKKLFFNLRKIRAQLATLDDSMDSRGDISDTDAREIAARLNVSETEVISMNRRMQGHDHSLNVCINTDQDEGYEWQDTLDDETDVEEQVSAANELDYRRRVLHKAMENLSARERIILTARQMDEEPASLMEMANRFGISRERVRQIEGRAFEKVQKTVQSGLNALQ